MNLSSEVSKQPNGVSSIMNITIINKKSSVELHIDGKLTLVRQAVTEDHAAIIMSQLKAEYPSAKLQWS